MKFSIPTKDFAKAAREASSLCGKNPVIPIHGCVLIEAKGEQLTISATTLDTTLRLDLAAQVDEGGALAVNAGVLAQFLAAAKGATTIAVLAGTSLKLSSGRSRITISTLPPEDFPDVSAPDGEVSEQDLAALGRGIAYCRAAASTEETRYYLNGVSFQTDDDGDLTLYGTNGHIAHRSIIEGFDVAMSGIVPNAACDLLVAWLAKHKQSATRADESGWFVSAPGRAMWGKMVDGTFPDITRIIPSRGSLSLAFEADAADMRAAVSIAMCGQEARAVCSVIEAKAEDTVVLVRGADGSHLTPAPGSDEVDATVAASFKIGVNMKYLTASMAAVGDGRVSFYITGAGDPFCVEPSSADDAVKYFAVVMPIRLPEGA
jgi:DNA polymerase-3 subunit beta